MIIYPSEIEDGISELVKSNSSVAYLSPVSYSQDKFNTLFMDKFMKMAADTSRKIDRIDLYPIQTILVSTGWNKNDDIFLKDEVWDARFSAEDKPFNYMHDQPDIIGHITGNFIIDDDGKVLANDIDIKDVPDKFHIVTPAVIYRYWDDKAIRDRIEKIIAEIESGDKWFVSMECIFQNFDYGIMSANGENKIVPRNEKTAGLTKFLRFYGGSGKISGGYTIGRVLRSIVFSGKGLVKNPANLKSIILNTETFKVSSEDLGYINLTCSNTNNSKGNNIMADKELVHGTLISIEDNPAFKLIKSENESLKASVSDLTKKLAENSSKAIEEKVLALEEDNKTLKAQLAEVNVKFAKAETDKENAIKANVDLSSEVDQLKKDKTSAERFSSLIKLNASEDEAKKIVADFVNLSDEQFKSMSELLAPKWSKANDGDKAEKETEKEFKKADKASKSEKDDMKDTDKDGDCKAEKVVETAKAEKDASLGVTNVDTLESTRASISSWYESKVRNKIQKD